MKKNLLALFVLLSIAVYGQNEKIVRCGTNQAVEQLKQNNPEFNHQREIINSQVNKWIQDNPVTANASRAVITIPVVVHVIYRTANENISDAQVLSQIDVLNEDYARLNADAGNTPSAFSSIAANTEIQFCLAKRDPSGALSNGITRTQTTVNTFQADDRMKSAATGGKDPWPRNSYLNIWVCNLGGGLLGYAYPPGSPANIDGVVIGFRYFGRTGTLQAPYNKGRTATHEVGHWLNLEHIWGDDNGSCNGSDQVADTPNQSDANYGCPTFPKVSCSNGPNGDMFMNYMDYTDDGCMNIFTAGQKARMLAVLNGTRASLKTSQGCVPGTTSGTNGCDTLNNFLANDNFVIYLNNTGGYIVGHNSFEDKAKAEFFSQPLQANQVLKGALMYFGVAKFSSSAKKIVMKVWNNGGTSGTPGTVLAQRDIPINTISTTQVNYFPLTNPISITTPYYIGFEMTYAAGDTVALFCTEDRGAGGANSAFEQFSNNSWFAFSATNSWGLRVALGIEAEICAASEIENPPVTGNLVLFPNPTQNELTINLELFVKPEPVDVRIFNLQGQLMKNYRFGSSQLHNQQIEIGELSSGVYFVEVQSATFRQLNKVILTK